MCVFLSLSTCLLSERENGMEEAGGKTITVNVHFCRFLCYSSTIKRNQCTVYVAGNELSNAHIFPLLPKSLDNERTVLNCLDVMNPTYVLSAMQLKQNNYSMRDCWKQNTHTNIESAPRDRTLFQPSRISGLPWWVGVYCKNTAVGTHFAEDMCSYEKIFSLFFKVIAKWV